MHSNHVHDEQSSLGTFNFPHGASGTVSSFSFGQRGIEQNFPRGTFTHVSQSNVKPNFMQPNTSVPMRPQSSLPSGPTSFSASQANGGRLTDEREEMASDIFDDVMRQSSNCIPPSAEEIPLENLKEWAVWNRLMPTEDDEEDEMQSVEMEELEKKYESIVTHLRVHSSAIELCCSKTAEFTSYHLARLPKYSMNKLKDIQSGAYSVHELIRKNFDSYEQQCTHFQAVRNLPRKHPERIYAEKLSDAIIDECADYRDLTLLQREVSRYTAELTNFLQAVSKSIATKEEDARAQNEPSRKLGRFCLPVHNQEQSRMSGGHPSTSLEHTNVGFQNGQSGVPGLQEEQQRQPQVVAAPRSEWSGVPQQPPPPVGVVPNTNLYRLPDLPPMTLPTFNGKLKEYDEFVNAFTEAVDRRPDLSEQSKMLYLKSYLRGDALTVLDGISWTGENYRLAKRELDRRFKGSNLLLPSLHHELEAMPKGQDRVDDQLRSLYTIRSIVRRMAGFSDVRYQPLLQEKILQRFSATTLEKVFRWRHEHRDFSGNPIMPTTDEMLAKVEEILRCEEFSLAQLSFLHVRQPNQQQNHSNHSNHNFSRHGEYKEYRPPRYGRHPNSISQSTYKGRCAENHHNRKPVNTAREAENETESAFAISVPTVLFTEKNHKNSSHLLTANVPVVLPGKQPIRTRVMFDTGATVSLVSKSFVQQHGIKPTRKRKLAIFGVGSHSKGEEDYEIAQLIIETGKGEKIKVNTLIFDNPIPPFNNPRLSKKDAAFVRENKIRLAEYPREDFSPPDLLLSLSATLDILDFRKPRSLPSGLRLLRSKFGYVIGSASAKDALDDSEPIAFSNSQRSRPSSKKASFAKKQVRETSKTSKDALSTQSKSSHSTVMRVQHVASGDKSTEVASREHPRQSKFKERTKPPLSRVHFTRPRRPPTSFVPSAAVADTHLEKGAHFSHQLNEYSFFWSEKNEPEVSPPLSKTDKIRKKRSRKVKYRHFNHHRQNSGAQHAFLAGGSVTGTEHFQ